MEAAQKVNEALAPMSDAEADFMALHHGEIESFLTNGSTSVGIGAAMFGQHLGSLKSNMVELEQLHQRTFDKHGKLQGADFLAERKRLMGQIDNSLGPLVRRARAFPIIRSSRVRWGFPIAAWCITGARLGWRVGFRGMQRILRASPRQQNL